MPRYKPSQPRPFDPQALGKFIATIRKAKGLSLGELAEASSASKAAIANLENGSVVSSIRTIEAVCSVLGVDPRSAINLGFGSADPEASGRRHHAAKVLDQISSEDLKLTIALLELLKDHQATKSVSPAIKGVRRR